MIASWLRGPAVYRSHRARTIPARAPMLSSRGSGEEGATHVTAILDYFAPLKKWLDEQTKGQPVGW